MPTCHTKTMKNGQQVDDTRISGRILLRAGFLKTLALLCFSVVLVASALVKNVEAQPVNEQDSLALVAFYNEMSGDDWFDRGGWLVDPVPSWVGVSVTNIGTEQEPDLRVNRLEMPYPNMGTPGELPPELGNIEYLDRLTIREDLLTGEVPVELGNLERLQRFRTSRCFMTGEYPFEAMAGIPGIQRLENEENFHVGTIPDILEGFQVLQRFDFRFNRLEGDLPQSVAQMPNLQRLRIGHNLITGDLPDLSGLENLQRIEIDNLPLTPGPIWPWLESMGEQITQLFFMNTNRTGTLPEWFASNMFALTDTGFGEDMPGLEPGLGGVLPDLTLLENVGVLVLQGRYWEGPVPEWLGNMVSLETIFFRNCSFSGDIPGSLANLTNTVSFHNCPNLTGGIPAQFELFTGGRIVLKNSPTFTSQYIYYPFVEGDNYYYAQPNQLTVGQLPDWIGNLDLHTLELNNVGVTGTIPASMANLTGLNILDLANNDIGGTLPTWLGERNIAYLDISNTNLEVSEFPAWLNTQEIRNSLGWLGLGGLGIGGEIPNWIGDFPLLSTLSLHDNNLTGPVPGSIGNLKRLDSLNLANNQLSGELPASFYDMGKLGGDFYGITAIDLSGNDGLTGELAMNLVNATEMRVFHYDGTGLVAPDSPEFTTWLEEVIPGNSNLVFPPKFTSVRVNPRDTSSDLVDEVPVRLHLYNNYPNPFNPSTKIRFDLPAETHVTLSVYNVLGQHVLTLVNEQKTAGSHEVSFDASRISSGTYIYRLEAGGRSLTNTMMLIK